MVRRHAPLLALLALAGSGAVGGAALARQQQVPATPAGKPVDCIQPSQIDHTRVRDDRTIDFFMRGRTVYRNTLPQSCPDLGFEEGFSYSTSINQLCSVDIITVLRHAGGLQRGASCGLGQFQPVTLPAHSN